MVGSFQAAVVSNFRANVSGPFRARPPAHRSGTGFASLLDCREHPPAELVIQILESSLAFHATLSKVILWLPFQHGTPGIAA